MSGQDNKVTRRTLLRGAIGSAAAVGLAGIGTRTAWGNELLSEDDPMAKALAYYADAAKVDKAAHANYKPEQNCANCMHYTGAADAETGGCNLFPGKSVAAKGWCKVWVAKP
ncbi:MAG: hypothetical protein HKN70_05000 [Gammaproteobacteria bacterium]|nr:hypothetical protein [Gammaproteobacteria bacterium]